MISWATSREVAEWVERNLCTFRYNPLITKDNVVEEALRLHVAAKRLGFDLTEAVNAVVRDVDKP